MIDIDKKLLEHLYIEFRYGKYSNGDKLLFESSWKNKLWEEHGVMNNMDEYCDAVINVVAPLINQWDGKEEKSVNLTLTQNNFPFETFFDTITIPIYITLRPGVNGCKYGGGYISGKSGWGDNGYHVTIGNFTLTGNPQDVLNRLRIVCAHELTHAYDDYCRRRSVKKKDGSFKQSGDNMWVASRKRGQYIASEMDNNTTKYGDDIGFLIYFTNNVEINGFIGQLKAELVPLMAGANNSRDAYNAIKKTSVYKKIEEIENNTINAIRRLDSPEYASHDYDEMRQDILNAYNMTRKKGIADTLLGAGPAKPTKANPRQLPQATPANNFHQAAKILISKFERLKKRFITQASKIAYDVYHQVGDPGTDNNKIMR